MEYSPGTNNMTDYSTWDVLKPYEAIGQTYLVTTRNKGNIFTVFHMDSFLEKWVPCTIGLGRFSCSDPFQKICMILEPRLRRPGRDLEAVFEK